MITGAGPIKDRLLSNPDTFSLAVSVARGTASILCKGNRLFLFDLEGEEENQDENQEENQVENQELVADEDNNQENENEVNTSVPDDSMDEN